ncbi:hemerythrin domain-containing protein [Micromonospora sp. DT233]|uniref:hemerythrin domain-containing protein n=1 Tax=Micromonospora sp. DT233 TaxID=3393432 RepID=UPI003CF8E715
MTVPLPPLPPVSVSGEEGYRPGGRNLADIVDDEHRQLLDLADRAGAPHGGRDGTDDGLDGDPAGAAAGLGRVVDVLTATVSRHLSAEEQYLFPTLRAALPQAGALVDREVAETAALLTALKALTGPADPALAEVSGRLRRHVAGVAALITELRRVSTDAELIRLGNRWEIAEEAAPTRPHPGSPATPPWNRLVEPALGVVDKVRDAVTRRPTYVTDLDPAAGRPAGQRPPD